MQALNLAKHRIGDAYRSVVSNVVNTSGESRFVEQGQLTPQEFVDAGDQLAFKFPTWQWESGQASHRSSYLPQDKQFLITRNVPCRQRVRALEAVMHMARPAELEEDDWLLHETVGGDGEAAAAGGELRDVDDLAAGAAPGAASSEAQGSGGIGLSIQDDFLGKGSALPDFSDLDAQLAEEDPAAQAGPAASADGGMIVADAPDLNVVQTRTYDLSITYDKYYQTPRLWLFGYDETGQPLRPEEVYEDVLCEYVAKTVTVDPHPLTGTPTVSIHPCKHALVMKKVVQDWIEKGITPRHDLALFVFLKFISSVVPTINYDFTMDIEF